jgi:hypothetical protein
MVSQVLVARATHFDRGAAGAAVAPVPLVAIEPFARAAVIAHKKIGLLFLMSGMKRHDSIDSKFSCPADASSPAFCLNQGNTADVLARM